MKKALLVLLTVSLACLLLVALVSASDTTTVNGYVSDSQCGAKGAKDGHADCMNKCIAKGAKAVIVTDSDQKVLTVDNPDTIKGHEGHHVAVTGHVMGDSVHIESVKML